jgi:hypothetical protein
MLENRALYRVLLALILSVMMPVLVFEAAANSVDDIPLKITNEYYPQDFERFSPQSTLDLVSRVPGFSIRDLDTSRRGISGATGNVLINGRPVTSKSGSIFSRLADIPVDRVEKIVTFRSSGGATGRVGELVADVIVKRSTRISGVADGSFNASSDGAGGLNYNLSTQFAPNKRANFQLAFSQAYNRSRGLVESETIDEFGPQLSREASRGSSSLTTARAEVSYNFTDKIAFNASGHWDRSSFQDQTALVSEFGSEAFGFDTESQNWELNSSLAYGPPDRPTYKVTVVGKQSDVASGTAFGSELDPVEMQLDTTSSTDEVVVLVQNNTTILGRNLSVDVEWSQTRFESSTLLGTDGADFDEAGDFGEGEGFDEADSFAESISATESRFTGQARMNLYSGDKLSVDVGLGAEHSRISSAGTLQRSLSFITPYAGAQYNTEKYGEFSFSAERTVAQLGLESFATNIDPIRGFVDNGNTELNPEALWTLSSVYRNTFKDTGSFDMSYTEEFIDGVTEFILLENGEEGFGNAGTGRRRTLSSSIIYPFNEGWLKDATLSLNGAYAKATFVNQFTGERLPLSSTPRFTAGIAVEKQFSSSLNLSAGLDWSEGTSTQRSFDRQEFGSTLFLNVGAQWSFAEHYQLSVSASGAVPNFDRETFTDFDTLGTIFSTQARATRSPVSVFMSLTRTF